MDIDEAYTKVGEFGLLQQKVFWGVAINHIVLALHQIHNVFIAATPKFYCKSGSKSTLGCPQNGETCSSYVFTGEDFTSVTSKWNLVCDKAYKADAIQSYLMLGILFGSLIFGFLGDKYGRRTIVYSTTLANGLVTLAGIVAPTYPVYAALRLLSGIFVGGSGMLSFVICTEVIGKSKRSTVAMVLPMFFAFGIALFSLMSYFITEWRMLSVVTALPTLLGVYFYFVIPESPRWLYSQGRVDEAERLLEKFYFKNTGQMPNNPIVLKPLEKRQFTVQPSALDLIRHPIMRSRTLNNMYTWFVLCVVYQGLTMSSGNLGSNLHMSVALSGLVEVPAYMMAYLLMERIGRRLTYSFSMLFGGACCLVLYLVPPAHANARMGLGVCGKMGISLSSCVAWLYAAEMYPTNIRNKAMSVCNLASRAGGIVSPLIIAFGKSHLNMDFVTFGILTLVAGVVCLKLPETLGKSMPETVDDLDPVGVDHIVGSPKVMLMTTSVTNGNISEETLKLLQDEIENNENVL